MKRPDGGTVAVCYLHGDDVAAPFHTCMIGLLLADVHMNQRIQGMHHAFSASNRIADSRNDICEKFLTDGDCDWLWFVDADMAFDKFTVEKLVAVADPEKRPIVGGLAFGKRISDVDHDFNTPVIQTFPTIYKWTDGVGYLNAKAYPPDTLVQVNATGAACVLIHRSVLQKIADEHGPNWFTQIRKPDGSPMFSEDLSFCFRAEKLGFPIHVHTGIKTKHAKVGYLDEEHFDGEQILAGMVEAATVVVIPVKDKLSMTRSLLEQLEEQGEQDLILVYDNGSNPQTKRWLEAQDIAEVHDARGLGIHEMWNCGIEEALARFDRCNILFLNNDLRIGDHMVGGLSLALQQASPDLMAVYPNYDGRPSKDGVDHGRSICAGRYDGTGGLSGFAFMVRGEWFRAGWRFPEDCMWWYGDNLITLAMDVHGKSYGMVRAVEVEHLDGGSQTIGKPGEHPPEFEKVLDSDFEAFVRHAAELGVTVERAA